MSVYKVAILGTFLASPKIKKAHKPTANQQTTATKI